MRALCRETRSGRLSDGVLAACRRTPNRAGLDTRYVLRQAANIQDSPPCFDLPGVLRDTLLGQTKSLASLDSLFFLWFSLIALLRSFAPKLQTVRAQRLGVAVQLIGHVGHIAGGCESADQAFLNEKHAAWHAPDDFL